MGDMLGSSMRLRHFGGWLVMHTTMRNPWEFKEAHVSRLGVLNDSADASRRRIDNANPRR